MSNNFETEKDVCKETNRRRIKPTVNYGAEEIPVFIHIS